MNDEEYEMKFLISLHINPAALEALTDEEKAAIGNGHARFIEALKNSGEMITTQALVDPSQAAVVTVRNGQPVVTDGPFLEAKEFLGGFYLIDCENKERAIELASQIPDAAIEGLGVEVRQVMFADGQLEA
ncbi:YciI family protein [Streptomyces sp. NPDC055140]